MRHRMVFLALSLCLAAAAEEGRAQDFRVLVFSKTTGFRHASIPDGVAAIRALGASNGFAVDATEDATVFTDAGLAPYQAVVFLSTTGEVLDAPQQSAFERYIRSGGAYVGVHAAADTEYGWAFYGGLVGAYFKSHPAIQSATIKVADRVHPSSRVLPKRWQRSDEWYDFQVNPRGRVHVLATLDESTYSGGTMGADHPFAWCQVYEGGRSWYTAGGHTSESFADPVFRAHLLGGIRYAAGAEDGDCKATLGASFEKVILEDDVDNAVDLAVTPDGRVVFIEMDGSVRIYDPVAAVTRTAGNVSVFEGNENGLIGLTLDPGFAHNRWLYLFYTPAGPESKQRIARFTLLGDVLDPASERVLLEFPIIREECCHAAGSMTFDAGGNLFIAAGDDTNPFDSQGYAPLDERPGRAAWDAQRSSANTNDLRGKILRITPQPDGSYTIPPGNLFPGGTGGRAEIYTMGHRNPYRISVDPETGWLYWGDVGPDANFDNASRGPRGYDEWNQARGPGNYGWPYCIGPNRAYRDRDFSSGGAGPAFDCAAPVNDSPNNTGARSLPPAQPAWIWYPYGASTEFPEVPAGNGRTAMAGPVYHYDPDLASPTKLPAYYDDTVFLYEWSRGYVLEVKLDDEGALLEINPFAPEIPLTRPIAMRLGPDGALYVLEWGSGFGGDNVDARLVRIGYRGGTHAPVALLDAAPTSGPVPLTVDFSAAGSYDPDAAEALDYTWDFDADGTVDATGPQARHTYTRAGSYTAQLVATDAEGLRGVANVEIVAGNTRPVVTMTAPVDGGFFEWGDVIPFAVSAVDAEEGSTAAGTIDCADLTFQLYTGHDDHTHPQHVARGCTGTVQVDASHGVDGDNLFQVVEAVYRDEGAGEATPLAGRAQHRLHPRRLQAEHASASEGTTIVDSGDAAGGGQVVTAIDHGDYLAFAGVDLHHIDFVTFRAAAAGQGGRIEVRADAPDGPLLGAAIVAPTGHPQLYRDVTTPVDDPGGRHDLYLVFARQTSLSNLFNLNWIDFHGSGVADRSARGAEGLAATYFDTPDLMGAGVSRVDPQVNFNWSTGAPLPGLGADGFSVRWTGHVAAPASEDFTFHARSSDGMRVWLDGRLLIDEWVIRGVAETSSAPVPLEAGRRYALTVEYFDDTGEAQAHLLWSSASTPAAVVPARLLYPGEGTGTAAGPAVPVPTQLTLEPAYPSPFRGRTTLVFTLPAPGPVRLEVFDVMGRRQALLVDGPRAAGTHRIDFEPGTLASGLYLYRLHADGQTLSGTMLLLR